MKLESDLHRQLLIEAASNVADFEGDLCIDASKDLARLSPHTEAARYDEVLNEIMDLRNRVATAQGFIKYITPLTLQSHISMSTSVNEILDKGLEMMSDHYADDITGPLYPSMMVLEDSVVFSQNGGQDIYVLNDVSLQVLRQKVRHNVDKYVAVEYLLTKVRNS